MRAQCAETADSWPQRARPHAPTPPEHAGLAWILVAAAVSSSACPWPLPLATVFRPVRPAGAADADAERTRGANAGARLWFRKWFVCASTCSGCAPSGHNVNTPAPRRNASTRRCRWQQPCCELAQVLMCQPSLCPSPPEARADHCCVSVGRVCLLLPT